MFSICDDRKEKFKQYKMKFFCNPYRWEGRGLHRTIGPQMQRANICFYKQCGKQIHLLSQINLQTAFSQLSPIITVKVIEATVPSWPKRLAKTRDSRC